MQLRQVRSGVMTALRPCEAQRVMMLASGARTGGVTRTLTFTAIPTSYHFYKLATAATPGR